MNHTYSHPTPTNTSAQFITLFKTTPMNACWRLA